MLRAMEAKLSARERKDDLRRKIVLGAAELPKMGMDERYNAAKLEELSSYLTREDDRKLFGLPPVLEAVSTQRPETVSSTAPILENVQRAIAH